LASSSASNVMIRNRSVALVDSLASLRYRLIFSRRTGPSQPPEAVGHIDTLRPFGCRGKLNVWYQTFYSTSLDKASRLTTPTTLEAVREGRCGRVMRPGLLAA
jgi:hypothetical protein